MTPRTAMRRPPLAWRNFTFQLRRSAAATAGVSFALLLVFVQAGSLDGARANTALLYTRLDADLVIAARGYLSMTRSEAFPRARLGQAAGAPGVAAVGRLNLEGTTWRHVSSGRSSGAILLGTDPDVPIFADPALNARLPALRGSTVFGDRASRPGFGPWRIGDSVDLGGHMLTVAGDYALGFGLIADGSALVGVDTFERVAWSAARDWPNLGLVRVAPGADVAAVAERLRTALPPDVTVATKTEMILREQHYFLTVKPVGIIFKVGMAVAFIAGAVLLAQALSGEITARLHEYATLRALGFSQTAVYAIGLRHALLLTLAAYGPALGLAAAIGTLVRRSSGFPVEMTLGRALFVGALALAMCALASAFALQRLRRADPAALYLR